MIEYKVIFHALFLISREGRKRQSTLLRCKNAIMSSLATGPRMMSNKTKSISMQHPLPLISCISAISLITIALLSGHGIGFATAAKEVATNTFYVKITPDAANSHQDPNEVAHKIARRNGFHNLGPVRMKFINLMTRKTVMVLLVYSVLTFVHFL